MSYTNSEWRMAVEKLIEMTAKNSIKWEISNLFDGDAWTSVDNSFSAEKDRKIYVISRTRNKYFLDEENYAWEGGYNFSIYESSLYNDYQLIGTSPSMTSLSSLYDAAEKNLAYNRGALRGLI